MSQNSKIISLLVMVFIAFLLLGCSQGKNELSCDNPRNIKRGIIQQTWFTQPVRDWKNHGGAIFDNKTGEILKPGKPREGNYCIDDKTIYFQTTTKDLYTGEVAYHGVEKIKILSTDGEKMVLLFEDGTEFTYYNPRHINP